MTSRDLLQRIRLKASRIQEKDKTKKISKILEDLKINPVKIEPGITAETLKELIAETIYYKWIELGFTDFSREIIEKYIIIIQ
jgi:hypothetical protein